jgi:hypothetical protein
MRSFSSSSYSLLLLEALDVLWSFLDPLFPLLPLLSLRSSLSLLLFMEDSGILVTW